MKQFELFSIDLTGLGNMAIGERENWSFLFDSEEEAKAFANKDYKRLLLRRGFNEKKIENIKWEYNPLNVFNKPIYRKPTTTSGDLLFIEYLIIQKKSGY